MKPHNFYERLSKAQLRGNTPPSELKLLEEVAEYMRELEARVSELEAHLVRADTPDGYWKDRAEAAEAKLEKAELLIAGFIFCGAGDDAIIGEIRAAGLDIQTRLKAAEAKVIELEAEVERLRTAPKWKTCDTHGQGDAFSWGCPECVREMRAKLRAVEGLPKRWRRLAAQHAASDFEQCADELEAALRGEE